MRSRIAFICAVSALTLDALAAQPTTRPAIRIATPSSTVAAQVRSAQTVLASATPAGTYALDDVLQTSIQDGALRIDIPDAVRQPGKWRLEIQGSKADWVINSSGPQPAGFGVRNRYSSIYRYDLDEAEKDGIWSSLLSISDQAITLTSQFGAASEMQYTTLSMRPGNVRLIATERNDPGAPAPLAQRRLTLTATSLLELRGKHPGDFRRFVAPALRRMLGKDPLAVRAADAYRAFAEIPADPRARDQVKTILDTFQSPDASAREKASVQLDALGTPGVLAALRTDQESLTPEQRSRLNEFILAHGDRRYTGQESLSDIAFLIDCLEFDDARVRRAARQRLAVAIGRDVEFDPEAPEEARTAAADRLRETLGELATTQPATRPADAPAQPLQQPHPAP